MQDVSNIALVRDKHGHRRQFGGFLGRLRIGQDVNVLSVKGVVRSQGPGVGHQNTVRPVLHDSQHVGERRTGDHQARSGLVGTVQEGVEVFAVLPAGLFFLVVFGEAAQVRIGRRTSYSSMACSKRKVETPLRNGFCSVPSDPSTMWYSCDAIPWRRK